MGTGISDPTVTCNFCNGDSQVVDVAKHTGQQWQCPNCDSWNDWGVTPSGNPPADKDRYSIKWFEPPGNPFTAPRSLFMEEHDRVDPDEIKASADYILNRRLMISVKHDPKTWRKWATKGVLGMGKSKALRKAMKKANKKRKKAGLPKLSWDMHESMIAGPLDFSGYLVPPVTHASNDPAPPAFTNFLDQFINREAMARNAPTAEREEKSPVWYLENWLMQREEYSTLLNQQIEINDPNVVQAHSTACDEALAELQAAEAAVNNLFKR